MGAGACGSTAGPEAAGVIDSVLDGSSESNVEGGGDAAAD